MLHKLIFQNQLIWPERTETNLSHIWGRSREIGSSAYQTVIFAVMCLRTTAKKLQSTEYILNSPVSSVQ